RRPSRRRGVQGARVDLVKRRGARRPPDGLRAVQGPQALHERVPALRAPVLAAPSQGPGRGRHQPAHGRRLGPRGARRWRPGLGPRRRP
ncbi:hypothetical protein H632_c5286p0, partial [Helicosporidium sp. ATCC 50920]